MREGTAAADLQDKDVSVQKEMIEELQSNTSLGMGSESRLRRQEGGQRQRLSTDKTSGREALLHSAHCVT